MTTAQRQQVVGTLVAFARAALYGGIVWASSVFIYKSIEHGALPTKPDDWLFVAIMFTAGPAISTVFYWSAAFIKKGAK